MPEQSEIEVGEIKGDGLRLWLAQEAQRQADKRLASQMDIWNKFVTRATSCIGWAITLASAFAAISTQYQYKFLAFCAFMASGSAVLAAIILWPRPWNIPGDMPSYVMDMETDPDQPYGTELEAIEALVLRAEGGIKQNSNILKCFGYALLAAFALLIASVILGAWWVVLIAA